MKKPNLNTNDENVQISNVQDLYVLKAFDYDGAFYGYYAPHPDEEGLPYYDEDINNAITFEDACEAESMIDDLENGAELQIIVERVRKVSVKLGEEETAEISDED